MSSGERTIEMEVFRYRPETDSEPVYQRYIVPFTDDMSVLQGLLYVKDYIDGRLSFRWSCRMAVCGSCGKMIAGVPQLACKTFLRNYYPGPLRVEPLARFPVDRDLIVVQDDFFQKLEQVTPYLVPKTSRRLDEGEYLQTPAELERFAQFSHCINCLLCYSACPQYGLKPEFMGPAVLTLLHRYNADSRDGARLSVRRL